MLAHHCGGPSSETTLLLIHAMGADSAFWDACIPLWEDGFSWIAPDLRNAGASPSSDRPVSIEDHARDLAALCDALGEKQVVPVGCAVGAMIAAAFAGMYPDRCEALVLANPGYRIPPETRAALAARADDVRAKGMEAAVPSAIGTAFLGCPEDARKQAYRERFIDQDPVRYALQIEGMLDADLSPHLPTLRCPVLCVAGGNDRLLPPAQAELLQAALLHCELLVMAEAAHLIPYQRPAEFAGAAREFIRRVAR